jgi:UDP-N-acetylglucosamine acyltransferase
MTVSVHPTAVIDPGTVLDTAVVVGPYAVLGPGVTIGQGTRVSPHAVIEHSVIGRDCLIGTGAVLGAPPQDRKYAGEQSRVEIGDRSTLREYVTVSRGSASTGRTSIGRDCYLMSYAHVAHDCVVEDGVMLSNLVQLGGHVHVEANASIGGSSAVHQFARIGTHAFVGGGSHVRQDVPPYAKASGHPVKLYGINAVGLRRAGIGPATRLALQRAFRLLFNSELTTTEAIDRLRAEAPELPEVIRLLDFVTRSERGVLV